MANFSISLYNPFDAQVVDPVMYSEFENLVRASEKGLLGDSDDIV